MHEIRRFLLNMKRLKQNIPIQPILSFNTPSIHASVLRLDTLHPIVSGNKWYKLKFYIEEAQLQKASTIASFGGPYSNHLVAMAYAAKEFHFKSIGYVRSNEEEPLTPTLKEALQYGMELKFLGRTHFQKNKEELIQASAFHKEQSSNTYWIEEGGYGKLGAKGAATILEHLHTRNDSNSFTHIIAAVGTGTMLAGLIQSAQLNQKIIGIPVLKNEGTIEEEIKKLIPSHHENQFTLLHDFHLGGYAKTTPNQFQFMNQLWATEKIPTDIVYTSKLFMAVEQLIKSDYFPTHSNLLMIHSGGLQGNRSLSSGILDF